MATLNRATGTAGRPVRPPGTKCPATHVVVALVCSWALSSSLFAARDRPHLDTSLGYNVLLTDNDTLLRGVSLSFDGGDPYGSLPVSIPNDCNGLIDCADSACTTPFGDIAADSCPADCLQPDLDDILCAADGTAGNGCPQADIFPCNGGDGAIDVDDVSAVLDAFAGNPACADVCP